jgi:arylsulfatase A-like enzyme
VLLVAGPLTAPRFRPVSVIGVVAIAAVAFAISALIFERGRVVRGVRIRQAAALVAGLAAVLLAVPAAERDLDRPRPFVPTAPAGNRPNVVLIVMDTVRADHLSVYGYHRKTTPWLERFAARATLYRHCFAASNYTLASHASMFTGLYPRTHGATNLPPGLSYGEPLDGKFETLAEKLAGLGYFNAAVIGNLGFLGRDFHLDQGFHVYDARSPVAQFTFEERHSMRYGVRNLLWLIGAGREFRRYFRDAAEVNETAVQLLDQGARMQVPIFLFVNYMDAHFPYLAPPPYDNLFQAGEHAPTDYEEWVRTPPSGTDERAAARNYYMARYDESIRYVDSEAGKLVEKLEQLRLFDNTMIIVTSDHGEGFGEHDTVSHGWSLYQEELWVPLLIKYPRQTVGRVSDNNVSLVDLMPTVLEVVGAKTPEYLHGVSLLSVGENQLSRPIFAEAYLSASKVSKRGTSPAAWSVMSPNRLKLIRTSSGGTELYDLDSDPKETRNLYAANAPEAARLAQLLEEWQARYPLNAATRRPMNSSTIERLRSLGYVQ